MIFFGATVFKEFDEKNLLTENKATVIEKFLAKSLKLSHDAIPIL